MMLSSASTSSSTATVTSTPSVFSSVLSRLLPSAWSATAVQTAIEDDPLRQTGSSISPEVEYLYLTPPKDNFCAFDLVPDEICLMLLRYIPVEFLHVVRIVNRRFLELGSDKAASFRKPTVSVVVCGLLSVGKSTLIGRLSRMIAERQANVDQALVRSRQAAWDAAAKAAAVAGDHTMADAFIADRTPDERRWRRTIACSRVPVMLSHAELHFINVSGCRKQLRHMVRAIFQADWALIVVGCVRAPHRLADTEAIRTLLIEHIKVCMVSGKKKLIVIVNKMDLVEFSCEQFEETVGVVTKIVKRCSYAASSVTFVPVVASVGVNFFEVDSRMSWYQGLPLVPLLRGLALPVRAPQKRLRFCIDGAFRNVSGVGVVLTGTILQGVARVGQSVKVSPFNKIDEVSSMHLALQRLPIDVALPGEYISLHFANSVSWRVCNWERLGVVAGFLSDEEKRLCNSKAELNKCVQPSPEQILTREIAMRLEGPMHPCSSFEARVVLTQPIGRVSVGYAPVMQVYNAQFAVRIATIHQFERRSKPGVVVVPVDRAETLCDGDTAVVTWVPIYYKNVAVHTDKQCSQLGRYIIRDGGRIVGAGVITKLFFDPKEMCF